MKFYTYFSNQQRFAIVGLVLIIICLEFLLVSNKSIENYGFHVDSNVYSNFQNEVALQLAKNQANAAPKIYPFNPNFITDYKGYKLGMTSEEINRLLNYRATNKWVNSAEEFQKVTKVSDLLIKQIAPYFKFPSWVTNKDKVQSNQSYTYLKNSKQKIDLNTATAEQLQKVYGIGSFYSERIIRYRDSFEGGFISDVQLQDVRGLTLETIDNILKDFTVKTPRVYLKINLNTATIDQLVTVDHVDYELAYEIIELRMLKEGYEVIEELTKVKGFPVKKLEIIKLYLTLN
jgi:DNA uptake protein ComE-like DNA-binding protein